MYHIALSKTKHLVFVNANPMSNKQTCLANSKFYCPYNIAENR